MVWINDKYICIKKKDEEKHGVTLCPYFVHVRKPITPKRLQHITWRSFLTYSDAVVFARQCSIEYEKLTPPIPRELVYGE